MRIFTLLFASTLSFSAIAMDLKQVPRDVVKALRNLDDCHRLDLHVVVDRNSSETLKEEFEFQGIRVPYTIDPIIVNPAATTVNFEIRVSGFDVQKLYQLLKNPAVLSLHIMEEYNSKY